MRSGSNLELVAFVGFVPLILGFIGVKRCKPIRWFWLSLVIVFGLLALGPVIHFAGRAVLSPISFLMPYRLLALLPYGDIPRVPSRYSVMAMLCLSVLASAGAWSVLKRRTPAMQRAAAALLTVLVIGENAVLPLPLMSPNAPPFFRQLRDDGRRAGVLEVPIPDDPGIYPQRMLYQTIHNKPIFGGYISRGLPPLSFSAVPGFAQFKALSGTIDDVVIYDPEQLPAISRAVLNIYSAGYVVIEKTLMNPAAVEQARDIANRLLGTSSHVFEDDLTLAYTVPPLEGPRPTAVWLDSGWSYLERLRDRGPDGRPLRWHWMGQKARLGIMSGDSNQVRLRFTAQAFGKERWLQLTSADSVIATFPITTNLGEFETTAFRVGPGAKTLELTSLSGTDVPGEDARQLSVALYRLELVQ
jgi:hypothetical protein